MSKLYYKAFIEDIQNDKCTDQEIERLVDVYASTVKRMATTLARRAHYELADFHMSKQRGIDGFSLTIERKNIASVEHYSGSFQNGQKNLKVIAVLEKE